MARISSVLCALSEALLLPIFVVGGLAAGSPAIAQTLIAGKWEEIGPQLDPSGQAPVNEISHALGVVQPKEAQALALGKGVLPSVQVTWQVPAEPAPEGSTETGHGRIDITFGITGPGSESQIAGLIAFKQKGWGPQGSGQGSGQVQPVPDVAVGWAAYLLLDGKDVEVSSIAAPFRKAAEAGKAQIALLQAAYERAVAAAGGGLVLSPTDEAFYRYGDHSSWQIPLEAWSKPLDAGSGTGILLEAAGLSPALPYVANAYWPCGDRAVFLEVRVETAGLNPPHVEPVPRALAAWQAYAERIRKAATSVMPCPSGCRDSTGESAKASGSVVSGPWRAKFKVLDKKGLVISDLYAEKELVLAGVRVPHIEIEWPLSKELKTDKRIIRFDAQTDGAKLEWKPKEDTLSWCFEKVFQEEDLTGILTVTYDFIFRSIPETRCTHYLVTPRECFRFIPLLRFRWSGNTPKTLWSFTPFYRIDYGPVGLAATQDGNYFFTSPFGGGREWFLTKEVAFAGARYNQNEPMVSLPGDYDNMHTARPEPEHNFVGVPVCRNQTFDCVHIHWRWGKTFAPGLRIDPMVDPVTGKDIAEGSQDSIKLRGEFYLSPAQAIDMAIVLDKPSDPLDPDDPFKLVDGDTLATITRFDKAVGAYGRQRLASVAGNVVMWYRATAHLNVPNLPDPTFFRQGFFVLRKGDSFAPQFFQLITMGHPAGGHGGGEVAAATLDLFEDDSYQTLRPDRGAEAFTMLTDAVAARRGTAPDEATQIAEEGFSLLAEVTRWTMVKALDAQQGALLGGQAQPAEPGPWRGPELPPGPARTLLEQAAAQLQAAQTAFTDHPDRFQVAMAQLQQAWQNAVAARAVPASPPL